jgi:hypothetical protein
MEIFELAEGKNKQKKEDKYWQKKFRKKGGEFEQTTKGMAERKNVFANNLYKFAKKWKGNEWMKKAIDRTWDADKYSLRSKYTYKHHGAHGPKNTGGEGGQSIPKYAGDFGTYSDKSMNRMAHTLAAYAQQIKEEEGRAEDTEDILEEKVKRSGYGTRSSTIMTGGHEGVLARAKTKKTTLLGA